MKHLIKKDISKIGKNRFMMRVEVDYNLYFSINFINNSGEISSGEITTELIGDTINLKDIFIYGSEDYDNNIYRMTIQRLDDLYIDFSGFDFVYLERIHLMYIENGFGKVLNLNVLNVKRLEFNSCNINYDCLEFINKFIYVTTIEIGDCRTKDNIDIKDIIRNMKYIEYIFLESRVITITNDSFQGLEELNKIYLHRCEVTSLSPFKKLIKLEELTIINLVEIESSSIEDFANYLQTNPTLLHFTNVYRQ